MIFKYKTEIYPKSSLIKAAYHFTDNFYVHLDERDGYFIVTLEPKSNVDISEKEFNNELLAQVTRYEIFEQTKELREISLARALASTVIEKRENISDDDRTDVSEADILKNWFE